MTVKDIDSMSFDELKNEFIQFRKMMMDHISEQEKQIQDYKKKNEELTVPEGEDICEKCGSKMHIKKYQTKEELVYEPARLFVRVTHIPVLECENCQIYSEEGKSTYHTVTHHFLFDRSICSPELLAYIIDMKYNNGLPLYTIEKIFQRDHAIIPR